MKTKYLLPNIDTFKLYWDLGIQEKLWTRSFLCFFSTKMFLQYNLD